MKPQRILVLGAAGMAGHVIHAYLKERGHDVAGADIRQNPFNPVQIVDFRREDDLLRLVDSQPWNAVINAVGVLNKFVDANPADGIFLNSVLPHLIVKRLQSRATKLIHMSTDCVFSGSRGQYAEDDFRDGDSLYDRSKAMGEVINAKDITLRQSIIGPDTNPNGIGLFNWFMQAQSPLNGYTNAVWNGVTTIQLAKGMETALEIGLHDLYHHITPTPVSKHNLLQLFAGEFRSDVVIKPQEMAQRSDKTLVNTRPLGALAIPAYPQQLAEMRTWIEKHAAWYPHYRMSS